MANKSGTSPQIISVPKGGGALQGIGETFEPDLFTGTGNLSVPIALPPGRNGFQPELNLVYSTGNGKGPFGLGWALIVPGVSRKTSKRAPRNDDAQDVFVLSGAEDLVSIYDEAPHPRRYRPRTERLFARITDHRNASNDFWEVWLRSAHRVYHTLLHERRFDWDALDSREAHEPPYERTRILIETDGRWFRLVEVEPGALDLGAPPTVAETRRWYGTRWIRARPSGGDG